MSFLKETDNYSWAVNINDIAINPKSVCRNVNNTGQQIFGFVFLS